MNDETYRFDPNEIRSTTSLCILCYFGPLFLVPMFVNKNSPYTKFHVNQGIVFLLLSAILGVVSRILSWIPFIGALISSVIGISIFVLMIIGIVNAAQGKAKRLPIIGNIDIYR